MGQQILGYSNLTAGTSLIGITGFNKDVVINVMPFWSSLPSTGASMDGGNVTFYDASNTKIFKVDISYLKQSTGPTIQEDDYLTIYISNSLDLIIGEFYLTYDSGAQTDWNETNSLISGVIDSIDVSDSNIFNSNFNMLKITNYTGLHGFFQRTYFKLYKLNKRLDYYLKITSDRTSPTHTVASNYSGVTVSSDSVYLVGNILYMNVKLTLTSTAQTNLGTGNITNTTLCTFTFNNFINSDTPSNDDDVNFGMISHISTNGGFGSGYSAGNASPASGHYICSISGSTLTMTVNLDALYAKTSEFRFIWLIPISRVASCYD